MHTALHIIAAGTSTTTHSKSKGSSSTITLLFIVVLFGAVYLLFIRPRQQRVRQQQTAARQLEVGDQVVTASGLYGRLVSIDSDTAEVEVAPGVVISMMRRAVNPRPGAAPSSPPRPDERGSTADSGDDDAPDDKPDQPS